MTFRLTSIVPLSPSFKSPTRQTVWSVPIFSFWLVRGPFSSISLFYQKGPGPVHAEMASMLEIEAKYPLVDASRVLEHIRDWGARLVEERSDADHYFNAPDRDFARTDEAVRIRRIGPNNYLTYKGPKIDSATKSRKEIEVAFAGGDEAAAKMTDFLQSLGYRSVAIVGKNRQIHEMVREGFTVHFCFDDVDQVGRFMEIEIVADEEQFETAKELVQRLAAELGLPATERRSYLQMLLGS
jgi:adenylate cyclase class 2